MTHLRRRPLRYLLVGAAAASAASLLAHATAESASVAPKLRVEQVGSDSTSFNVVASIISGPTEAILWDAQYHLADAQRLADRVAASGRKLKAVIISHPDHDHFAGAAAIVERFPGTPVYMTAKALEEYRRTAPPAFRNEKSRSPQLFPDSIVTPTVLPSMQLTVDGQKVEVIPDLTGDVITGVNSVLWIPSISTVLASDVIFNNVHAWFGSSDTTSRRAWRQSIERIASLEPKVVIAGHKRDVSLPDSPDVLRAMDRYIADFDSLRSALPNAPALFQAMSAKYPTYSVAGLLRYAAMSAYGGRGLPGMVDDATVRPALTAVNKAWSQVRLTYDGAAAERMLAPDFYVQINGNRQTRQEFIAAVSQRGPTRLVRFDNPILTITKDPNKDEYVAVVMEKLEQERDRPDGSGVDRMYSLWVTRDGFRRVGSGWQIVFSEAVSFQNWVGQKPPFADW